VLEALAKAPNLITEGLRMLEQATQRTENPLAGLRGTLVGRPGSQELDVHHAPGDPIPRVAPGPDPEMPSRQQPPGSVDAFPSITVTVCEQVCDDPPDAVRV